MLVTVLIRVGRRKVLKGKRDRSGNRRGVLRRRRRVKIRKVKVRVLKPRKEKWLLIVVQQQLPRKGKNSLELMGESFRINPRECSDSVVECLTRDRGATDSSLTGVTGLWSLSKTHLSSLRTGSTQEDRPFITERLLMGCTESNKQTNKSLIQDFEADLLWKVSLKMLNLTDFDSFSD